MQSWVFLLSDDVLFDFGVIIRAFVYAVGFVSIGLVFAVVFGQVVDNEAGTFGWVANGACEQVAYIFRGVFAVPADGFLGVRLEVVTAFDGQSFTDGTGDGGGGGFEGFGAGGGGCPLPSRAVFLDEHFSARDTAFSFHGYASSMVPGSLTFLGSIRQIAASLFLSSAM